MKIKILCVAHILIIVMLGVSLVWAEAPVEDISEQLRSRPFDSKKISQSEEMAFTQQIDLTITQRLSRLEQQLNNIVNMNLPQQISDLQQQLGHLRGQLQEQEHYFLQLFNCQQHSFHRDLGQRIVHLKNLSSSNSDISNNSTSLSYQNGLIETFSNVHNIHLKNQNTYRQALDSYSFYGKQSLLFEVIL